MSTQENGKADSSAGGNANDAIFEPKPKPKMIRVLTVLAYVLSVSMAAILLSIYYIFIWDGKPHLGARRSPGMEEPEWHSHNYTDGTTTMSNFSKHDSNFNDPYKISESEYFYNTTTASDEVLRSVNVIRNYNEEELTTTTNEENIRHYTENSKAIETEEVPATSTVPTTTEEIGGTLPDEYEDFPIASSGTFIRKMFGRYQY